MGLFHHKCHHHKQQIRQPACEGDEICRAAVGWGKSTREKADCQQKPRQRMAPTEDEKAEARGLCHSFVGPDVNKDASDNERNRCPGEVGEIEKAFDHNVSSVIASEAKQSQLTCNYEIAAPSVAWVRNDEAASFDIRMTDKFPCSQLQFTRMSTDGICGKGVAIFIESNPRIQSVGVGLFRFPGYLFT